MDDGYGRITLFALFTFHLLLGLTVNPTEQHPSQRPAGY
jgi:hypothetical protein